MSASRILVTGGAGFIGSHIVDALIEKGYRVRVFDSLDPQVHGQREGRAPEYLNKEAEFIHGDVRDLEALDRALEGVEAVYHEAAAVGVGQSMYQIRAYTEVNTLGTANLLELIVNKHRAHIRKMIVASSMSIYGEGRYIDPETGEIVTPLPRTNEQMEAGQWEMLIPGPALPVRAAQPVACDELKPLDPTSIYAINKRDQEEMILTTGRAYGIPAVALRYFNVYGPRQALSNPYTGIAAIFSARFLNNKGPIIFEDGAQSRDFIHVRDIARANVMALEREEANWEAINVGTGVATTVHQVARMILENLHPDRVNDPQLQPSIPGQFRSGDIRHCIADISKARRLLAYEPTVRYEDGVKELIGWVRTQQAEDRTDAAYDELAHRKLVL